MCRRYIRNLKTLASLNCWAGRFEFDLVENPEDTFSQMINSETGKEDI